MNPEFKVQSLCSERDGLRREIILMEKSMHQCAFTFLLVAGAWAGILVQARAISADKLIDPGMILMIISQIEVFMALFAILLMSNMNVHAGYIRAIETKINLLAADKLNCWETEVTKKYLFCIKAPFGVTTGGIALLASVCFILLVILSGPKFNSMFWGIFITVEAIFVIAMLIWSILKDTENAEKLATTYMSSN